MSTGYQIVDQSALYYLTLQVVDWIDIFTRQVYRDIVIESLKFCQQNKDLQIFGYVIMSNHVHLIANSPNGHLSETLRDFKKFTAKTIINTIKEGNESRRVWMLNRFGYNAQQHSRNKNYQLWTHENHAVILFSNSFMAEKLDYLHNNPVRAGLVDKPEDYRYSSARNYAEMDGLLEIVFLDLPWKTYR
ncbi:MAG TPA: transposase [Tenuifilaceae bacterium]|nr:transposase [Tenuifilaceae bacterium]HRX66894.1 transposase [Tenuifilaceae bacterium]